MKRLLGLVAVCALAVSFSGCITLHSASISGISTSSASTFETAEASGVGVLHLSAPEAQDLEREALKELASKGATRNITTRLSSREFGLVQVYKVTATGEK